MIFAEKFRNLCFVGEFSACSAASIAGISVYSVLGEIGHQEVCSLHAAGDLCWAPLEETLPALSTRRDEPVLEQSPAQSLSSGERACFYVFFPSQTDKCLLGVWYFPIKAEWQLPPRDIM